MPGVVVGIDGSEHARRALLSAVAEARLRGVPLTVVHAAPLPFDLSAPILARQPTEQELRSRALQLIEETLQDLDTGDLEVERVALIGHAASQLCEATTLLAEDPALAGVDSLLHHSILGAIATGSVTAGRIASRLGRQVSNLVPALGRLVDAGFVIRQEDPIRKQRPTYAMADAYLQFHYAILEPHRSRLRSRDPRTLWEERLTEVFDGQVRGPVFEQQARTFVERFASDDTVPGERAHVGPSRLTSRGREWELDLVVTDEHPGLPPVEVTSMMRGVMLSREVSRWVDRIVCIRPSSKQM